MSSIEIKGLVTDRLALRIDWQGGDNRVAALIIEIASVLELIAMSHLSEQILQTVEALSAEEQRQVLNFVEFLWAKRQ